MSKQNAGKYRHIITIQKQSKIKNENTGEVTYEFVDYLTNIRADVHFLSANERIAASAVQSKITARIEIRYRTDSIVSSMRIKYKNDYYEIDGVIPDNETGMQWITLTVHEIST